MKKDRIALQLPAEESRRIRRAARKQGLSLSEYVRQVLRRSTLRLEAEAK